jgi:hypothetical protein
MPGFSLCKVNCMTCQTLHIVCRQMSVLILFLVISMYGIIAEWALLQKTM